MSKTIGVKTGQKVMGLKAKFMPKPQPTPYLEFEIKANQVTPAPPLGPELGERGVNVAQFCKDINGMTAHINDGVPLDVKLWVNADRTYRMVVNTPQTSWLIMRAAGIRFPAPENTREIAGYITPKHAYEIAKIKQLDQGRKGETLESLTEYVIHKAYTMGVRTVSELNAVDYREFLEYRKVRLDAYFKQLEDEKLAKTLRTEAAAAKK